MTTTPTPRGANNFDFMRLLAALLVVIGHSFFLSGNSALEPVEAFTGFWGMADIAVHIFFVMSGFLVAKSWMSTQSALGFAGKRALRIFPALTVAVIFTVFVVGPLATNLPVLDYLSLRGTWAYLSNILLITDFWLPGAFTDNIFPMTVNGSLWTLPFEVSMYISLMVLGVLALLGMPMKVPVLLTTVGFFVAHGLTIEVSKGTGLGSFLRLGAFFYAGASLYFFYHRLRWNLLIAVALIVPQWLLADSRHWPIAHALTLPYLVIYFAHLRIPAIANMGKAGDFSYGLYIFSFPLQQLMAHWWGAGVGLAVFMLASVAASGVLAVLSWHLVEAPAMRLKRYLPGAGRWVQVRASGV